MQILSLDLNSLPNLPPLALTIGNYDGVHLGHQALLSILIDKARTANLSAAVMVFEPQPQEFLSDNPPARLTNQAEKAEQLARLGVDYLLVADFDHKFCSLSASGFIQLLKAINVQQLILGDDFRFGQNRVGDKLLLSQAGFGVQDLPSIKQNDARISSSLIRKALMQGDLKLAKSLLGRAYSITGQVVHGDKIGRTLNFPTANVCLNRIRPAVHGVFAADVFAYRQNTEGCCSQADSTQDWADWSKLGIGGLSGFAFGSLFAAVSVGLRPSIGGKQWRFEVHLPQFCGDLYGITLKVVLTHFLHGERHYDGVEALKAGIGQDVEALLAWRTQCLADQSNAQ